MPPRLKAALTVVGLTGRVLVDFVVSVSLVVYLCGAV